MKRVGFIYDDVFLRHATPAYHPERKERLLSITQSLRESGLWQKLVHIKPQKAEISDIEKVHAHSYVERVLKSNPAYFDPDTYFSEGTLEASLCAAGAVIAAITGCRSGEIDRAFCAVRPPGHHAEADRAMGFCIFNNIAVGARYAQKTGFGKVFIADFDVHHGNGTQHMFYDDDTVFYFSTHQYPHYPGTGSERERGRGRGEGFTCNIPMDAGSGDREYEAAYHDTLYALVKDFNPDIFLASAGYDIHMSDPLASIRVSDDGIGKIVSGILSSKKDIPYIFTLEGGYNLDALGRGVATTIQEMMRG
ncbi:MAG: histone deacetylase family protein [bacterium]